MYLNALDDMKKKTTTTNRIYAGTVVIHKHKMRLTNINVVSKEKSGKEKPYLHLSK